MFNFIPFVFIIYLVVSLIIPVGIIIGIVAFINNRKTNNMDPNQTQGQVRPKVSAKDFFLNLGAFSILYVLVGNLLGLLFTVINTAYPKITNGYNYFGSSSISWPVATLVVLLPIFILLMWFLEREYRIEPEMQNTLIHRGLTYITLFVSGCIVAGDLVTVVYYFIDGQELTTGFLLKVLVLLIVSSGLFIYYISDLRRKLTKNSRIIWRIIAGVIVLGSIVWGFAVLGSPRTQRLVKYDEQKVTDLQNINSEVTRYFSDKGFLPKTIEEMADGNYYIPKVDNQNQKPYEYVKTGDKTYNLCAEFNKASDDKNGKRTSPYPAAISPYGESWVHPAERYCFQKTMNGDLYRGKPLNVYPI